MGRARRWARWVERGSGIEGWGKAVGWFGGARRWVRRCGGWVGRGGGVYGWGEEVGWVGGARWWDGWGEMVG